MERNSVKYILQKNARIIYFDRSSSLEELQEIEKEMKFFNPGYEIFRRSIIASVTNRLREALILCDDALDIGYSHSDTFLIQEVSMFMGVINRSMGLHEDSLKNYLNALKYGANTRAYNNIADIYLNIGDYSEAEKYLRKALNMLKNQSELSIIDERLLNIVYTNLSEAELKSGRIEEGQKSAKECIRIAKNLNDVFTIAFSYSLLGEASLLLGNYEEAMGYFEDAHQEYLSCDTYSQNRVFDYIEDNLRLEAKCLNTWGKFQESNLKLDQIKNLTRPDYELLIKNYEGLEDKNKSFEMYRQFMKYLKNEEQLERINRIEHFKTKIAVFESEKKANDYELLYDHTKSISSIGREIIASEKLDDVLTALHNHIDKIMDFNTLALASVENDEILYNWVIENNQRSDTFKVDINNKNSFSSWVVRNKKAIRLNDALTEAELKVYKEDGGTKVYGHAMDSMILCPIVYKDKVYGLINVQSGESYTYSEADLEFISMLASFIAIAMKNWYDTKSLKKANEKLEQLSKTDALTGISNRHVLSEIVEMIFRADKESNNIISVVMIDIDHFKEYNDTYGHIDGDRCLISVVDALRKHLDVGNNRLFRYGGDEFVAIMPFMTSEEVYILLEKVRLDVENLMIENKNSKVSDYVTCSFGFTTVERGSMEYQRVFYLADEALYMAKAKGKNCISSKIEELS